MLNFCPSGTVVVTETEGAGTLLPGFVYARLVHNVGGGGAYSCNIHPHREEKAQTSSTLILLQATEANL